MACACHICKRTGVRTCDPEEAEVKCMICGFCERQAVKGALDEPPRQDG